MVHAPNFRYRSLSAAFSAALLLAALAAKGKSTVRNIGQIERGYQDVDKKFKALGAQIERVQE